MTGPSHLPVQVPRPVVTVPQAFHSSSVLFEVKPNGDVVVKNRASLLRRFSWTPFLAAVLATGTPPLWEVAAHPWFTLPLLAVFFATVARVSWHGGQFQLWFRRNAWGNHRLLRRETFTVADAAGASVKKEAEEGGYDVLVRGESLVNLPDEPTARELVRMLHEYARSAGNEGR